MNNMNYADFKATVINELGKLYGEDNIKVQRIEKNNTTLEGVTVVIGTVCPTIYPESLYERMMLEGRDIGEVLSEVTDTVSEAIKKLPVSVDNTDFFTNPDYIRANVIPQIVGTEENEEFLSELVSTPLLDDMAVIYRIIVSKAPTGEIATTLATKGLLKSSGLSVEELHEAALTNAGKESLVIPLGSFLSNVGFVDDVEESPMAIISNNTMMYGSGSVLCTEALKDAAAILGTDNICLIPSSVHEFLAIPGDADVEYCRQMIAEVNYPPPKGNGLVTALWYNG